MSAPFPQSDSRIDGRLDDSPLAERLARCERKIGYAFEDKSLLTAALTHSSGAAHRLASNERLEFLGDAILGAIVCELLYRLYPNALEGELTQIKSVVVSRQTCAKISQALGLQHFIILGKGLAHHGRIPMSLLANVFESLVAAIYLDGGAEAARQFVETHLRPEIDAVRSGDNEGNYKSLLQQVAQRDLLCTPTYHVVGERGPDHAKFFKVVAQIGRDRYHPAWGRNKKEAEQRAACNALAQLNQEPPPYPCEE